MAMPRTLVVALLAITAVRLWAAAQVPLTEDEAYYRLWAQALQFGYYDHPPMIAWWIRLGSIIAGDTALGVRLLPALSCLLTSVLAFDLTLRLGAGVRTAQRAAIWYNATLIVALGGFFATPDAPAGLFWFVTLCCLARTTGPGGWRWWLAAGVAAGLAAISKYSALFLAPGVLIWLLSRADRRAILRQPWPWIAALLAAAIFATNVVWNAEHHWVSFVKQFGRVAAHRLAPKHLLEFVVSEIGLFNPIIAFFAARGLVQFARRSRGEEPWPDLSLLLATSVPFGAYLLIHSLHDRVQAHWPAPLYPALAICAAVAAERAPAGSALVGWRRAAAPVGFSLSVLVLIHMLWPATDIRRLHDPTRLIRDWPQFASQVETVRQANGAGWIGSVAYGTVAQLSFQKAIKAPVVQLMERDRYPPSNPSWSADMSRPGLVVDLDRRGAGAGLPYCFASVRDLGRINRNTMTYALFLVSRPRVDVLRQGCWGSKTELQLENVTAGAKPSQ